MTNYRAYIGLDNCPNSLSIIIWSYYSKSAVLDLVIIAAMPLWVTRTTSRYKFHTSQHANFAIPIL